MAVTDPILGVCRCNHDAAWLQQEITAGRSAEEYRKRKVNEDEDNDGYEYLLVCQTCNGEWDHAATDRLIERIYGAICVFHEFEQALA